MIPQFEPRIKEKYAKKVYDQMMTGMVGCGARVVDFENAVASVTGAKYALATTSGTSALMLALLGAGLKSGARVAFPSYTFLAGANAAKFLGYEVELVDINKDTLCMDPQLLRSLERRVDAVMFVNHNAYVGDDVLKVKEICDSWGVPMIEDSSQAFGLPRAGRVGQSGVFSLSVPKLVTSGQGGVVVTDDEMVATLVKRFRDHGDNWRKNRLHEYIGINLKFNDILAAYALAQIEELPTLMADRKKIFDWYRRDLPLIDFGQESAAFAIYHAKNAERLMGALGNAGYQAVQYYRPVHVNEPYLSKKSFPVAETLYREIVYLPSSLTLTETQVKEISGVVRASEGF